MPRSQEEMNQITEWERKHMIPTLERLLRGKHGEKEVEAIEKCTRILKWVAETKTKVESLI